MLSRSKAWATVPVDSPVDAQAAGSFTWFKGASFLQRSTDGLYAAHYQQIILVMSHRRQSLLKDLIKSLRPLEVNSLESTDYSQIENPSVVKLSR